MVYGAVNSFQLAEVTDCLPDLSFDITQPVIAIQLN